ncbi:MAG TPA: hypothetical protein VFA89_01050 [Terriglobales bacterium]|nr:hypothetical protein [Terriglobales bacterium]
MPILMLALLGLAVFGAIGILLTAAVILESKTSIGKEPVAMDTPAPPLEKHAI